jgi:ribosomal-protein-alanine N-acetyltransferase
MTISIQHLTGEYAAEMASLHEAAFHTGWSEQDFLENIDNDHDDVLGVLDEKKLQGFILVRTQAVQAEILTIAVGPLQRKKGMAQKLLKAGERAVSARGADVMFLEVGEDNPAAISLYEKTGYKRCGTRKGYYRREKGRVDALLFQKKLE